MRQLPLAVLWAAMTALAGCDPTAPPDSQVLLLHDRAFPALDTPEPDRAAWRKALPGQKVVEVEAKDLAAALGKGNTSLLITPYGSAIPVSAWPAMKAYLLTGGRWINAGGAPLSRPVRLVNDTWRPWPTTAALAREVGLKPAHARPRPDALTARDLLPQAGLAGLLTRKPPRRAWSLEVRLTEQNEFPGEMGSSGRPDAEFTPAVAIESGAVRLAAPVTILDRRAGGRWVFLTADLPVDAELATRLVALAQQAALRLEVRPAYAWYQTGETVQVRLGVEGDHPAPLQVQATVRNPQGQSVAEKTWTLRTRRNRAGKTGPWTVPATEAGLHTITATVSCDGTVLAEDHNGFWVEDPAAPHSLPRLGTTRDLLTLDDQPFLATGTTYMSTSRHRRFLFEPDPVEWEADCAAMRTQGVNLLRTGIWCGWRKLMDADGRCDEGALRAVRAFALTAGKHRLPLIFTYFAFYPETWGQGSNCYLDPAALALQERFAQAVAERLHGLPHVAHDLINEPSFGALSRPWRCAPAYDVNEKKAWLAWLDAQASEEEWAERWRRPGEIDLPGLEDFNDNDLQTTSRPLATADFRLFSQEVFTGWARRLGEQVREAAGGGLVTVGQDEGGTGDRPNPWFHARAVDFTSNHTWWSNDDLLWDALVTRLPDRPLLIGETGIMGLHDAEGLPRRSPIDCRDLLERKLALSFAGGAAGFVQWLWNTNPLLYSDNEAAIGLLRADGSAKPELEPLRGVAAFAAAASPHLRGRVAESICLVLPHRHQFATRSLAVQATRRAVRAFEYRLGLPLRTCSDQRPDLLGGPRLIVLPTPRCLDEAAWQACLDRVRAGSTLLVSGFCEADGWLRPAPRVAAACGMEARAVPVAREQRVMAGTESFGFSFGGVLQRAETATAPDGSPLPMAEAMLGKGRILWCPAPAELADDLDQTTSLYRWAAARAGFAVAAPPPGLLVRPVEWAGATLWLLVNESDRECRTTLGPASQPQTVPAGRSHLVLLDAEGRELAAYRGGTR